ncbi:pilus assembly protein MshD [Syntrophotalea acetylenivorans]|uniref:Pilus assembly protein MshD n=1 Tax=Syntrophotalea acetylenivorans TaxID=1842532 RepID=A0A1L3GPM1_9BACT|nr:prepilin-type N-terminal cleavage/methylation domain-containing protein [Syntrophotalea acetylenivorans]APG27864.1 pilus assembly protein MshD [Syntrophotalea acetylenivorans]
MMISSRLRKSRGFTLIELIISIVVVSIALGGVLLAINYTVTHSADPMLQHQALAIAESYLEEILLKPFADPDGIDTESTRALFDDVDDYNGLSDNGARDQTDTAINGLHNYTVDVTVASTALNGIGDTNSKKITVTVRHSTGINMSLSGYRTSY